LLGCEILGRLAAKVLRRRRAIHPGLTEIVDDRHVAAPTSS
jgi:hypothetical protein